MIYRPHRYKLSGLSHNNRIPVDRVQNVYREGFKWKTRQATMDQIFEKLSITDQSDLDVVKRPEGNTGPSITRPDHLYESSFGLGVSYVLLFHLGVICSRLPC